MSISCLLKKGLGKCKNNAARIENIYTGGVLF